MRGWLSDYLRSLVSPWYWNTRKALFIARGRTGQCPCHNPSDSGKPGDTRCEAVVFWYAPERFRRRVCPALVRAKDGTWVCGVAPEEVRTYWAKPLMVYAATGALVVGTVGLSVWGTMRAVGYQVTLRQVFWPRAWSEMRLVRAEFFRRQSGVFLEHGQFREALASLTLAYEMQPEDYPTAMLLAQINHLVRPEVADPLFKRIYETHPEQREETARAWFRSMLARGQLAGVAELASWRLLDGPADWPVWVHGLILADRAGAKIERVAALAREQRVPAAARAVLDLEARVRGLDPAAARRLLMAEPLAEGGYPLIYRVERLIEWGEGMEALLVLKDHQNALPRRDAVRLTLAAHAVARNQAALEREVRSLFAREGDELAAAVTLVGQHLIRFPNISVLDLCHEASARVGASKAAGRGDALAAVFCAAALNGRPEWLGEIRRQFSDTDRTSVAAQQRIEQMFSEREIPPLALLTVVRPVSLELTYAVIERALAKR